MSLERVINRNMIKRQTKEHNEGVAKRYRTKVSDVWHYFQEKRYGKENYTSIIRNNKKKK